MKRLLLVVLASTSIAFAQATDALQAARDRLHEGKVTESESLVRSYLEANPASADAHFLLAEILFREQRPSDSLGESTAGAKARRPTPGELRVVASDYVLLNDLTDADKWFTLVTQEEPGDAESWYLLGRTKYSENRFAEAVQSFQHALAIRPKDGKSQNNLGLSYEGLGLVSQARAAYETAIAWQGSTPTDAQPYLNLGTLLLTLGDSAGAASALATAASLAPENPKVREESGRALQATGDLPGARREFEAAVKLAPDAAALHFKLGQVYQRLQLKDLAQQEFATCARLSGTHSSIEVPNPFTPRKADAGNTLHP